MTTAAHSPDPAAAQVPARVLVVEDEPPVGRMLAAVLRAAGYDVETAEDGQEAILRVHNHPPSVVVMDVMTPELDGLEVTRYLKLRYGDSVQILVLTALDGPQTVARAEAAGAEYFATKPMNARALITVVGLLVALWRARDAADLMAERDARLSLARRLLEAGHLGLARAHVDGARRVAPDDAEVAALASRFVE